MYNSTRRRASAVLIKRIHTHISTRYYINTAIVNTTGHSRRDRERGGTAHVHTSVCVQTHTFSRPPGSREKINQTRKRTLHTHTCMTLYAHETSKSYSTHTVHTCNELVESKSSFTGFRDRAATVTCVHGQPRELTCCCYMLAAHHSSIIVFFPPVK